MKWYRLFYLLVFVSFFICGSATRLNAAFSDMAGVGTRGEGTGGALTALANDPVSALFYNPAGLCDIPGKTGQIGMGVYGFPVLLRDPDGSFVAENEFISTAPYIAYSDDRFAPLYWGIGLYGSIGVGFDFPKNEAAGIFYPMRASSGNVYLSPTVAYKINDKLSIGAGLNITYSKVEMEMPLGRYLEQGLDIDTDGMCYGVNIGLIYKPFKFLNLGLRWRSEISAELDGDALLFDRTQGGLIGKDDVTAHVYWPDYLTFGIAVHLSPKFVIMGDYEWINYSRFSDKSHFTYDNLTYLNSPFLQDMRDARRIHIGCEYSVNNNLVLRAGYLYNRWCLPNSQTAPLSPGNTYHSPHIGLKYSFNQRFELELAGFKNYHNRRKVRPSQSETGYPGTYLDSSHGIDIGFLYHF